MTSGTGGLFSRLFAVRRWFAPRVHHHVGVLARVVEDDLLALDNGAFRAVFVVPGEPLDRASDEDVLVFLSHLAHALNTLPPKTTLLARREPGSERAHLSRERLRLEGGAAPLAAALLPLREARLSQLSGRGEHRRPSNRHVFVLAVEGATKREAQERATRLMAAFGAMGALRMRGDALVDHLARRWRGTSCPPQDHFTYLDIGLHTMLYGPQGAKVRPGDPVARGETAARTNGTETALVIQDEWDAHAKKARTRKEAR